MGRKRRNRTQNKRRGNIILRKNKRHGIPQIGFGQGDGMGNVADIERMTDTVGGTSAHQGVVGGTKITPPAPDYWSAPEPKELKNHKDAPENHPVTFTPLIKAKIDTLMAVYPNIEWLCYLIGKREGNVTHVTDMVVPTQTVTSTRVDKIELEDMGSLPIVGVMHSHHGMGNGFSGTDDTYINANHLLSLCISHGGINGQFRWNTPEGDCVVLDAPVTIKYDFDFKVEEFVEHCKKEITEVRYVHVGNYAFTRRDLGALAEEAGYGGDTEGLINDLTTMDTTPATVPDFCPKCASDEVFEVGAGGWFCNSCDADNFGDGGVDQFNERIGFNDVPPDEQQKFDGCEGGWDTDPDPDVDCLVVDEQDYPLAPYKWREAEEIGYIQCDGCQHHYKQKDLFTGDHPVDKGATDLCRECFLDAKYHGVSHDVPGTSENVWDVADLPEVPVELTEEADKDKVVCSGCGGSHDYTDNFKTAIGDLCKECYDKWKSEDVKTDVPKENEEGWTVH